MSGCTACTTKHVRDDTFASARVALGHDAALTELLILISLYGLSQPRVGVMTGPSASTVALAFRAVFIKART